MTQTDIAKAAEKMAENNGGEVRKAKKTAKPRRPRPQAEPEKETPLPDEAVSIPETITIHPVVPIPAPPVMEMSQIATTGMQMMSLASNGEADDLLSDIMNAGRSLEQVGKSIKIANAILNDPKAIVIFLTAIARADEWATMKKNFDNSAVKVREKWMSMTLPEIMNELSHEETMGDQTAGQILNTLNAYKKSPIDVLEPLWRLEEIVREANGVDTYFQLGNLLKKLQQKGFVETLSYRKFYPEIAIVVGGVAYVPMKEQGRILPIAEAGWSFLKQAEIRAKERAADQARQLEEMKASTTGITPE